MATRARPDSAKAVKPKIGTDVGQGKRTTGTLGRSSSSGTSGKSTGSAAPPQRSPSSLKSTQSTTRADPSKPGKKEPGLGPTKPTPTPSRRQSIDRAPSAAQTQRVISAGPRERSVTVKSPSLSSPSKTTPSRAELGKSKTSPKPTAPTRAGPGSVSRSGPTAGRAVKKSSTPSPSPSPKPERAHHISDAIEAEPEKPQVIVDDEEPTPPPPPPPHPTIDDYSNLEDEPLEHDALIEEESHIHNQEELEEKAEPEPEVEEEKEDYESTLRATMTDEEESSKETEEIEPVEENHHDTVFEKLNENHDLEDDQYENHDHEDELDHQDIPGEGGTTITSPTEEPPLEKIEPAAEAEEKHISSPETMKEPKKNFIEETGDSTKIEALTISKSPQKLQIRAPNSSSGKKDSPVSNDVIKEAAGKLLEKRKNRVSALVGAFETVISLQEPDA